MAVVFHQQPPNYSTSDNPLLYVFESNQTTQENFSFIVETKVNGVTVSTERIFPEVFGNAHWDASQVVKTSVYKPRRPTDLFEGIDLPMVQVTVTENYGTTPVNQASASSGSIMVFKAKLEEEEWKHTNVFSEFVDQRFLTDVPNATILATREQDVFSQILSNDEYELIFSFYDSSGVLQGNHSSGNIYNPLWNINASYDNLIAVFPALDSIAYVEIVLGDSDKLTILYMDEDCINKSVISWINKYGAFDQFVFTHYNERRGTVDSQFYEKQFGTWDGTTYSFNETYGSIETVKTISPTGYIVSGWLTKEVQNWLVTLYQSIGVMLDNEKTIRITTSSYTEKTQRFEELINEEITYTMTSTKSLMI